MQKKHTKVVKYRLFAALCNEATMRIAMETPFSRVSNGYILLYKRGGAPEGYKELTDKMTELLTKEEKEWLQEVNLEIMQEFAAKHAEAQKKGIIDFGKRFERALRAQLEKETEAAGHA